MSLICSGCNCPKNKECGKCLNNLSSKYCTEINTIENLATFGSGEISSDGIKETYLCGSNGNYKMFEKLGLEKQ